MTTEYDPLVISVTVHEQEPIVQLTSALLDVLNDTQFNELTNEAKVSVLRFVTERRMCGDGPGLVQAGSARAGAAIGAGIDNQRILRST